METIISISGKPGLYRVASQGRNAVIVENIEDKKKFAVHGSSKISSLDDISIYTIDEDMLLFEVYAAFKEKLGADKAPSHKLKGEELRDALGAIFPIFDDERMYDRDIQKLFQWYNILSDHGLMDSLLEERKELSEEEGEASDAE